MDRYPLAEGKSYPLIERIKRNGGVEVNLGGGQTGFVSLELRNELVVEGDEQPNEKDLGKMKPDDKEKLGRVKVAEVEKKKAVFIDDADRNFKAAFPKRDRFTRDLSDAPPELRASLIATYEQLTHPTEPLNDSQQRALAKLKPIMDASGYVPPRRAVDPAAAAFLKDLGIKSPAQSPKAAEAQRPAPKKPEPGRGRERSEEDRTLDTLRKHPYWLVSDPEAKGGKGIAIKVAPWYDKADRKTGRLVGFKVLDTYRSSGRMNPLPIGSFIQIDASGNIQEKTAGGFETSTPVPEGLRKPENAAKLRQLVEADKAKAEAPAAAKKPGAPTEAPKKVETKVVDPGLEERRTAEGWVVSGKETGIAVKVKPYYRLGQAGPKFLGYKVAETYASQGWQMPLAKDDVLQTGPDGKLLPAAQRGTEAVPIPKDFLTDEVGRKLQSFVQPPAQAK